jgi:Peroxidase
MHNVITIYLSPILYLNNVILHTDLFETEKVWLWVPPRHNVCLFLDTQGCDGSVLLNSANGNVAEKDALPNLSLRGFGSVERVKAKLEKACPNTVSCADVVALMTRDAVWLVGYS